MKCYAEKVYMPGACFRRYPGFICGIKKEAVVAGGKPLPGSCCLDAPYELDVVNWGPAVRCHIVLAASVLCSVRVFFSNA